MNVDTSVIVVVLVRVMGLLEQCEDLFNTSDLYKVVGVCKEASDAEIRRGYYKVSLQVHPDRAPDDELATTKFQVTSGFWIVIFLL